MEPLPSTLGRAVLGPLLLGFAYYGLAALSFALADRIEGIATVWPPSGLLLATLLAVPRARLIYFALAAALASMIANLDAGASVMTSAGYSVANVLEALIATLLLRWKTDSPVSFIDPEGLWRFFGASFVAAVVSALIATLAAPAPTVATSLSWFTTVWLGMLIVAPLLVSIVEVRRHATGLGMPSLYFLAIITLALGASFAVFFQDHYPLLFLPMMALLVSVLLCGAIGAIVAMVLITIVGSLALMQDMGPATLIDAPRAEEVQFFQFYLLALYSSALPMAALLAARDRLRIKLAERIRLLSHAESAAHIGHWRLDPTRSSLYWSPEVFRIHGLPKGQPPTLDRAIAAYHPDDRSLVSDRVAQALRDGQPFEFCAKVVWPDGTIRHVMSRGERDMSSKDDVICLFGLTQDVTEQVEARRILEEAHAAAEQAAQKARIMAETDVLTGLSNRRKIIEQLNEALHDARGRESALSVAIFDIDHFKAINDGLGHAVGDDVLKRVATFAAAALRDTDMIGRIGGEEFALLLPGTPAEVAMPICERVRLAVAQSAGHPDEPPVTISIGVASALANGTAEALLKRADDALYAAKHAGRNQTMLAS